MQGVLRCCFLCCGVLAGALPVLADTLPLPPSTQSQIEQQQAERLKAIEEARRGLDSLQVPVTEPDVPVVDDEACIEVSAIELSGNTVLSDDALLAHLTPPLTESTCLGLSAINQFLRILTNAYVDQGYITSRALLEPQDLSSGVLTITIMEGRLERLLLNGEPERFLEQAFVGLTGEVLNLRDIEQGLEQINRLKRYNAQIKMRPGSKLGFSIIDIQTATGHLGNIEVGFSNSGQPSTGEGQLSLTFGAENALGALGSWRLTGTRSSEFVANRDSRSLYFSVDIPLGYWNAGYRTAYSTYYTEFDSRGLTIDTDGKSNSHDVYLQWLFFRDGLGKSALSLGVSHRRDDNYLMDSLIDGSSRNLSSATLTLEFSRRLWGGYFTFSPALALGTDWFGGESDSETDSAPAAQFTKGSVTASVTYPLSPSLYYSSTLFGQWNDDTLYGSQRLSIGGEYSVRGFKNVALSGDEGYYWRNELTWDIGQFVYLGRVQSVWALDTGTIAPDSNDVYEGGSLFGASVALSSQGRYASAKAGVGLPIESPSWLAADDYAVYYHLSLAY